MSRRPRPVRDLAPEETVASFDSASAMHASIAAALRGQSFWHIGQIPWLPGTTLLPVSRRHDPEDVEAALEFGRRTAPALLERNPDIVLLWSPLDVRKPFRACAPTASLGKSSTRVRSRDLPNPSGTDESRHHA